MSLDYILLGLLRQPRSGYDLKNYFDERIKHFWAAELSQIYPTLHRLRRKGWLFGHSKRSANGPPRRVYELTNAGRKELQKWLESGPAFGDERVAYCAQLFLMAELGSLVRTARFLTRLRETFDGHLRALREIEKYWAAADARFPDKLPSDAFHQHMTLRAGVAVNEARIVWCDECIERIRTRQENKAAADTDTKSPETKSGDNKSVDTKNPETKRLGTKGKSVGNGKENLHV